MANPQRKRILFCLMDFKPGGIAKAQCDLANALVDFYDVDVLPFRKIGPYLSQLKPEVNVLTPPKGLTLLDLAQKEARRMGFFTFISRTCLATFTKVFANRIPRALCMTGKKLKGYDIAVSYAQNGPSKLLYGGTPEFVLNHVEAPMKIQFIHDDLRRPEYRTKRHGNLYSRFNHIVALSPYGANAVSELTGRKDVLSIPNIIDADHIIQLSEAYAPDVPSTDGKKVFLTCARIDTEKGLLRCAEAFAKTGRKDFLWIILGDGPLRAELEETIRANGLGDNVLLPGMSDNPYPYFLKTDYYLMCSFNEAFPAVIDEAHALGVPVLATDYGAASTQLFSTDTRCENNLDALTAMLLQAIEAQKPGRVDSKARLEERNRNALTQIRKLLDC